MESSVQEFNSGGAFFVLGGRHLDSVAGIAFEG
jgi:hypothetical protein